MINNKKSLSAFLHGRLRDDVELNIQMEQDKRLETATLQLPSGQGTLKNTYYTTQMQCKKKEYFLSLSY